MSDILSIVQTQILDENGDPAPGAKVYVYQQSTTNLLTLYTDADFTIEAANPIIADASGFIQTPYYNGGDAAMAVIADADDQTITTLNVVPKVSTGASGAASITFTPSADNPATNVQEAIDNASNPLSSTPTITNVNTVTTTGFARFASTATGAPDTGAAYGAGLLQTIVGGTAKAQSADIDGQRYTRFDDGTGYTAWVKTANGTVDIAEGGTGATDAETARTNLGVQPTADPAFTGEISGNRLKTGAVGNTSSDIEMDANAIIASGTSISFAVPGSGSANFFRFFTGTTGAANGIDGGTEVARIDGEGKGQFKRLHIEAGNVDTSTDIELSGNAVITSESVLNFGVESGGVFAFYGGITDSATGRGGGANLLSFDENGLTGGSMIASQSEAEGGASGSKLMTPQRTAQATLGGVGSALQNGSGSGSSPTENTHGRPIFLFENITRGSDGFGGKITYTMTVGPTSGTQETVCQIDLEEGQSGTLQTIVPSGWYYNAHGLNAFARLIG